MIKAFLTVRKGNFICKQTCRVQHISKGARIHTHTERNSQQSNASLMVDREKSNSLCIKGSSDVNAGIAALT